MFCTTCGSQVPEGAEFCVRCGTPVAEPDEPSPFASADPSQRVAPSEPTDLRSGQVSPTSQPVPPTGYAGHGVHAPGGPPGKGRRGPWVAVIVAAVVVIAVAVAVPLLVLGNDNDVTTSTTGASTTTSVAAPGSTSTTSLNVGAPGDSTGEWVEREIPGLLAGTDAAAVAVSDEALLVDAQLDDGTYELYAYMFDSGQLIELPTDADFNYEHLDGSLAVWWEGTLNESTGTHQNQHIYAYRLPDGPKVDLSGAGVNLYSPRVAQPWVTWVELTPLEDNPAEYASVRILGVKVNAQGEPLGEPTELVSSATKPWDEALPWSYDLSSTRLAWQNEVAVGADDAGVYVMDLSALQPSLQAAGELCPALAGDTLLYCSGDLLELTAVDLVSGQVDVIDPFGGPAVAGPTFAVYTRTYGLSTTEGDWFEIVARGFTGAYEQVLSEQNSVTSSAWIAASADRVAFMVDGALHLFEWQGLEDRAQQ